jgi:hypothetical protein
MLGAVTPPAPLPPLTTTSDAAPPAVKGQPVPTSGAPTPAGEPRETGEMRRVGYTTLPDVRQGSVASKLDTPARVKPLSLVPVPPVRGAAAEVPDRSKPTLPRSEPLVRMVNTKRITLNFEVKDVGPSGVSGVELWYTQDCKEWRKYDAPAQAHSYVVEVDEEGMYGFTLLAKSGIGLSHQPPTSGDLPQVWVIVDLTRPRVQLSEVTPTIRGKIQTVAINWKASDKNLGRHPITLSCAERSTGPWNTIATNLENSGHYHWQVPPGSPARLLMRVEATDLAGNVGMAESRQPVLLDASRPSISILNVEPNTSR